MPDEVVGLVCYLKQIVIYIFRKENREGRSRRENETLLLAARLGGKFQKARRYQIEDLPQGRVLPKKTISRNMKGSDE